MDRARVPLVVGLCLLVVGIESAAGSAPAPGHRDVVDGAGRQVRVPASVSRIVSLAPSVTEILFALGLGDRVVGVTDFCDYPPAAATRARIGGIINQDLERIVSLSPDLAVATMSGNLRDDAERLERLGIPVYTIGTPTVPSILVTLRTVGDLLGAPQPAAALVKALEARLDAVRSASSAHRRPRTLYVIEPDPLIAPGSGTFLGEALAIAGADLVTSDSSAGWAQYDIEKVIGWKPEVILTPEANREWARRVPEMERWRGVPAVAAGRVFVISDAIQHPGPRMVDGIEEVARLLAGSDDVGGEGTP